MLEESQGSETTTDATEHTGQTGQAMQPEPENRRLLFGVIVAGIVIVVIALVLLMLRGCDSSDNAGGTKSGGKVIVSVAGLPPQPGVVSVWVIDTSNIDEVLLAASVRSDSVVSMGGGRYVVTVPEGTESAVVARLSKVHSVADAGLVYRSGKAK